MILMPLHGFQGNLLTLQSRDTALTGRQRYGGLDKCCSTRPPQNEGVWGTGQKGYKLSTQCADHKHDPLFRFLLGLE